jgi:hypothetical protein
MVFQYIIIDKEIRAQRAVKFDSILMTKVQVYPMNSIPLKKTVISQKKRLFI